MPVPPSLVALPPRPTMMRLKPPSSAARISSPVPKVVVVRGLRRSSGTRAKPEARAISMTAVRPSPMTPHCAVRYSPSGPVTGASKKRPPVVSMSAASVPSPPSATGISVVSASGMARNTPLWMARAASRAPILCLKAWGAMTTRRGIPRLYRRRLVATGGPDVPLATPAGCSRVPALSLRA